MMKCLVFDRGDGVLGIGLKILFGGIDQFCIAWPDRPPERMTHDFLLSNGVSILGEGELILPSPKFETLEQLQEAWDNAPTIDDSDEPSTLVDVDLADGSGFVAPPVAPTLVAPPTPVLEPIAPVVEPTAPIPEPIAPVAESQPAPTVETPTEQPAPVAESTVSAIELV